ncbi:hypothetical protein ACFYNO_22600 [Kitasatospora sp. NPDC006697]|uniref:hypothetical protein n=1 Tax=Kitasatospora sp. NPDC006697 TaxID=3364020 RepID=UPI0036B2174B
MSRFGTLPAVLTTAGALIAALAPAAGTAGAATTPAPTPSSLSVFAFNVDLATSAVDSVKSEDAAGRAPRVEAVIR